MRGDFLWCLVLRCLQSCSASQNLFFFHIHLRHILRGHLTLPDHLQFIPIAVMVFRSVWDKPWGCSRIAFSYSFVDDFVLQSFIMQPNHIVWPPWLNLFQKSIQYIPLLFRSSVAGILISLFILWEVFQTAILKVKFCSPAETPAVKNTFLQCSGSEVFISPESKAPAELIV